MKRYARAVIFTVCMVICGCARWGLPPGRYIPKLEPVKPRDVTADLVALGALFRQSNGRIAEEGIHTVRWFDTPLVRIYEFERHSILIYPYDWTSARFEIILLAGHLTNRDKVLEEAYLSYVPTGVFKKGVQENTYTNSTMRLDSYGIPQKQIGVGGIWLGQDEEEVFFDLESRITKRNDRRGGTQEKRDLSWLRAYTHNAIFRLDRDTERGYVSRYNCHCYFEKNRVVYIAWSDCSGGDPACTFNLLGGRALNGITAFGVTRICCMPNGEILRAAPGQDCSVVEAEDSDYARISLAVDDDWEHPTWQGARIAELKAGGWTLDESLTNSMCLVASVYRHKASERKVLAFRRADLRSLLREKADAIRSLVRLRSLYESAAEIVASKAKTFRRGPPGSFIVVGHSLSGGFAQYGAVKAGVKAVTFNPTAFRPIILTQFLASENRALNTSKIRNYTTESGASPAGWAGETDVTSLNPADTSQVLGIATSIASRDIRKSPAITAIAAALDEGRKPFDEADPLTEETKDWFIWTNSLGMKFAPVRGLEGVLFCEWETRVRDFRAFVQDRANNKGYDYWQGGQRPRVLIANNWGMRGWEYNWDNPGFPQTEDHPVTCVSWRDAQAFCEWLTTVERAAGRIGPDQRYRLPSDWEWSEAVGLNEKRRGDPIDRDKVRVHVHPWGAGEVPPSRWGNYAGDESRMGENPGLWDIIGDVRDDHPRTSPVGYYGPKHGAICDLGGNVSEWCEDEYNTHLWFREDQRVFRGGNWSTSNPDRMESSDRDCLNTANRFADIGFRIVLSHDKGAMR